MPALTPGTEESKQHMAELNKLSRGKPRRPKRYKGIDITDPKLAFADPVGIGAVIAKARGEELSAKEKSLFGKITRIDRARYIQASDAALTELRADLVERLVQHTQNIPIDAVLNYIERIDQILAKHSGPSTTHQHIHIEAEPKTREQIYADLIGRLKPANAPAAVPSSADTHQE